MNDYELRFGGVSRLFSAAGLQRLRNASVCVVGIGGVGSWAVEALARPGVGSLTLVDLDDVCTTNINRQIHALDGEIGRPKVEAMADRARAINPHCNLHPVHAFFTAANAGQILEPGFDYVLDAIDSPSKKSLLIAACRERSTPVLVIGGAGGRRNPTALKITDLAFTSHDRLLAQVRSQLRTEFKFPRGEGPFGVECVYSPEPAVYPQQNGSVCAQREPGSSLRLDCESGYGTACFVTGTFGFVAAGHIVQHLAQGAVLDNLPAALPQAPRGFALAGSPAVVASGIGD
jgi:tRNA A37 threonylcarbamoyladenosine dehydratase